MTIDQQLLCYKRLPNWTATTLPEMVTQKHNTKVGTWAKLTILSGSLHFYELDEEGEVTAEHLFTPETEIPFVEPQAWHRIAAASDDSIKCLTKTLSMNGSFHLPQVLLSSPSQSPFSLSSCRNTMLKV